MGRLDSQEFGHLRWGDTVDATITELVGKTLLRAEFKKADQEIVFETDGGDTFIMHHSQDCCETVEVESIVGNLDDLVGTPIVLAEEVNSDGVPAKNEDGYVSDSFTWTFYRLRTIKGDVDIRWYGTSNGYYSESVDFIKIETPAIDKPMISAFKE